MHGNISPSAMPSSNWTPGTRMNMETLEALCYDWVSISSAGSPIQIQCPQGRLAQYPEEIKRSSHFPAFGSPRGCFRIHLLANTYL